MPWPTWDQAAIACVISILVWFGVRTRRTRLTPHLEPLAAEFALISGLYAVWRLARMLPIASVHGARERAHDIASFEQTIHLPTELALQKFVIAHEKLADFSTWYYATVHVPALLAFLVWLFYRHRDVYPRWRNALALVTAGCLIIRFIRVAPPRFIPSLGYVDLSHHYGPSVYSANPNTGVSDQFAAMPSIHVAWAAIVSLGIVAASTSRWRWIFLLHLVLTVLVVSATGNHWWLDGIVALMLLAGALWIDTALLSRYRARVTRPRDLPSSTEPAVPSCPASPAP
ncbi:phosphatase PAP2 family protein [Nocardioides mangrovi]|uniref:Phosphatase PAP2 family protein n=1 Tax=Nocardioides mangrovi TaxID=2874580 RepID=A0ABS7UDH3_9ACTN|nr:phosphatase PAP2 family protein [Nocardioides mangrovi]MBZ5738915.1 phosphatase PAP2 family protein [Nocardioides mangrovi]